jgi:hypothetical protein
MSQLFNIYCDESCHLESSKITPENRYMVLGGVSCPNNAKDEVFRRIKDIKKDNGLSHLSEMKWTKIANGKLDAYKDLINYFFDYKELSFRAIVIDKEQLNHDGFAQTHDQFYYKIYWQMLEWLIEPSSKYHIYLDIKDTQGVGKVKKLQEVLCNSKHDFDRDIIAKVQEVRSHEVAIMQLTDLLIGAISYANRYPEGGKSEAKETIIELIRKRSGVTLKSSTLLGAKQFNVFCWEGRR